MPAEVGLHAELHHGVAAAARQGEGRADLGLGDIIILTLSSFSTWPHLVCEDTREATRDRTRAGVQVGQQRRPGSLVTAHLARKTRALYIAL